MTTLLRNLGITYHQFLGARQRAIPVMSFIGLVRLIPHFGKNVRKLSLLSGGERSLTALAFLFAVFRSRPSPFYVMDEVEAALDKRSSMGVVGDLNAYTKFKAAEAIGDAAKPATCNANRHTPAAKIE